MRKLFVFFGLVFLGSALLVSTLGSAQDLVSLANRDLDPNIRAAASSVLSQRWATSEGTANQVSDATLFSLNGATTPSPTPEGRSTGFLAQRTRMINTGDPLLGPYDNQTYADAALAGNAAGVTDERRLVRAGAVMFSLRNGFAIVPGGPAEAFKRLQTCLNDGNLVSNEGGSSVQGVSLDCSDSIVRLAMADTIASGFYQQFGFLVGFGCSEILDQANNGGTVEARWAAANAYVSACGADLADVAENGGSAELRAAAVAPLARAWAAGGSSAGDLLSMANGSGSTETRTAAALGAGLVIESSEDIVLDSTGNPSTGTTGNLFSFSLSGAGLPSGAAAIAPLARFYSGNGDPLVINIGLSVSGSSVPLTSSVLTL